MNLVDGGLQIPETSAQWVAYPKQNIHYFFSPCSA